MKIALASDHGGYRLKTFIHSTLMSMGYDVMDLGINTAESVDYPDVAKLVTDTIRQGEASRGILVCGSGIGMSIAANRVPEIRAALCHDEYTARMSRAHNDANVLVLGERVLGEGVVKSILDVWFATPFEGGRHCTRIEKLK
jgi:ribose 5-phosphate isomerase B